MPILIRTFWLPILFDFILFHFFFVVFSDAQMTMHQCHRHSEIPNRTPLCIQFFSSLFRPDFYRILVKMFVCLCFILCQCHTLYVYCYIICFTSLNQTMTTEFEKKHAKSHLKEKQQICAKEKRIPKEWKERIWHKQNITQRGNKYAQQQ